MLPNKALQPTVKKLRFSPSAELQRWAPKEALMFNGDYFQLMAKYNRWMNRGIFGVCAQIPESDRRNDLGAFFKSIHETLDHIYYGDKAWMNRFSGKPVGVDIGEQLNPTFESLKAAREEMDTAIIEWSERLDDEWLKKEFRKIGVKENRRKIGVRRK